MNIRDIAKLDPDRLVAWQKPEKIDGVWWWVVPK